MEIDERTFDVEDFASQADYIRYSRDVEHSYSKGVALLYDLVTTYIERCEEAYNNGKNAVWTSALWEVPLIYACDAIPVSYTEAGRLSSPNAISAAEDYFQIPRETCSMVKAALGEWHLRKKGIKRVLGYSSFCEPYNHAMELLKDEGFDVHFVDTPYNPGKKDKRAHEEYVKFVVEELKAAAEWLGGKKLDEEKLGFEIKRMNLAMGKVRRILDLRIETPLFLKSLPTMLLIMGVGHYFGEPEKYMKVLDTFIAELEEANGAKFKGNNLIPLVWAGGRGTGVRGVQDLR